MEKDVFIKWPDTNEILYNKVLSRAEHLNLCAVDAQFVFTEVWLFYSLSYQVWPYLPNVDVDESLPFDELVEVNTDTNQLK